MNSIDIKEKLNETYEEGQLERTTDRVDKIMNCLSSLLSKLEKNGFTLREVKWTGKLQAPSLTDELAVNFSFSKNK